ncbi:HD domain-containing phosphohydrolase [Rhodanobacter glycinis]|nr:HD domain-containing phosphohydrolase [Rhodanobacter glycinis]
MFELQQLQALERPLVDAQQEAIRNHCERSAAMLREHGMSSEPWLDIVQDHHERPDDSGYPAHMPSR